MDKHTRVTQLLVGVVLLLAILAVYSGDLLTPLEYDEDYTVRWYSHSPVMALIGYTRPNNHFLHSLAVWGSVATMGESALAVRFPALAAGLLSLALLYRVAIRRGLLLNGVLMLGLGASSAAMLHYGHIARGYTLSILLTLCLLWLLNRPRPAWRALTLVSYGLVITLPTLWFALLSAIFWRYWQRHDGRVSIPIIAGGLLGSLHYLPALLAGQMGAFAHQFGFTTAGRLATDILQNWSMSPLWIGLVMTGVLVALIYHPAMRRLFIALFGGAMLLTGAAYLVLHTFVYGRNYIYLLAPLLWVSAAGWGMIFTWVMMTARTVVPNRPISERRSA